ETARSCASEVPGTSPDHTAGRKARKEKAKGRARRAEATRISCSRLILERLTLEKIDSEKIDPRKEVSINHRSRDWTGPPQSLRRIPIFISVDSRNFPLVRGYLLREPTFPRIESPNSKLIAPWWHTALLIALFLGMAVFGAFFQRHARSSPGMLQQHPQVVPLYLSLMAMEWGLFIWVWKGGLRRTGTKVSELIGGRWASAKDVLADCGLAFGLWGGWTLVDLAWIRWFGSGHAASIQTFLPQRALEITLWIGVCISAGFCEELV